MNSEDEKVDEIARRIITEIEHAKWKDLAESDEMIKILHLTHTHNARVLLKHAREAPKMDEQSIATKAVVEALLVST